MLTPFLAETFVDLLVAQDLSPEFGGKVGRLVSDLRGDPDSNKTIAIVVTIVIVVGAIAFTVLSIRRNKAKRLAAAAKLPPSD